MDLRGRIKPFILASLLLFLGCGGSGGAGNTILLFNFAPPPTLEAAEVLTIVQRAALAIDDPALKIAVTDRVGRILAIWSRDPAPTNQDLNRTLSVARTAAFMSSAQGPITTRTLETLSQFHYPPTFGALNNLPPPPGPLLDERPPQRDVTGVAGTPQGPLWQIFTSNRGAPIAGAGLTIAETGIETFFNAPLDPAVGIPPPTRVDGTAPGPGLAYIPGSIPLYKEGRVVGSVGCFGTDFEASEFAAIEGARGDDTPGNPNFFFPAIPEGAIFLGGILLPYVGNASRPPGTLPGAFVGTFVVAPTDAGPAAALALAAEARDPYGNLIGPRADPLGMFTLADVTRIRDQGIEQANRTRAAIRLPFGSATKMVICVTNRDGLILSLFRMDDAPVFSIDVCVAKARNATYFSSAAVDPLDQIPGVPAGTAITARTLGFTTQPFFPPGIDSSGIAGPLFLNVAIQNQDPAQFNRQAHAPFRPGLQNGVVMFPGSTPLYDASGNLIGGLGVSGDGVEQDDLVTAGAAAGFEPPEAIRADQFFFNGVRLPYYKFPQNPGN
jgi:uncharacterized protein GlcG (DUF336 family)